MKIRAFVTYIILDPPAEQEHIVELPADATVQDLLNQLNCSLADLSDYYELSGAFAWNDFYLPYLETDGGILYDVPYTQARLKDFLVTHHIENGEVHIVTGYPQAGGPGFLELAQIWQQVEPILEQIELILSLGAMAGGVAKGLCSIFKKRKRTPHVCFDIVFSRKAWNHVELGERLELSAEETKNLLRLCGYEYDRKRMQYVQTERVNELKDKLKNVQIHDV